MALACASKALYSAAMRAVSAWYKSSRMAFAPVKVFHIAPNSLQKMRPCQGMLACYRQAFFGHAGTHGQVGAAQFYQINGTGGGLQHLCQCAAQGFGEVEHSELFKLWRPLQGNVPVAVGPYPWRDSLPARQIPDALGQVGLAPGGWQQRVRGFEAPGS